MNTVYIIGDIFFRCSDAETILKLLKGKKRLVIGNHDSSWINKVDLKRYFVSVDNLLEISDGKHALTIRHLVSMTTMLFTSKIMNFGV